MISASLFSGHPRKRNLRSSITRIFATNSSSWAVASRMAVSGPSSQYEIPTALAERLHIYRNEIAPAVTGKRPDAVFITWAGEPRTQILENFKLCKM
jgi:hypothetical protein